MYIHVMCGTCMIACVRKRESKNQSAQVLHELRYFLSHTCIGLTQTPLPSTEWNTHFCFANTSGLFPLEVTPRGAYPTQSHTVVQSSFVGSLPRYM